MCSLCPLGPFPLAWSHLQLLFLQAQDLKRFSPSTYPFSVPDNNFRQQSGMDIHRLDQAVQQYYLAALTSSTHKTYKAAEPKYLFILV